MALVRFSASVGVCPASTQVA